MNDQSALDKTKRLYSVEEITHIYNLGRFHLENGNLQQGEAIMRGISEIAPENPLGWLGLAYVYILNGEFERGQESAGRAIKTKEYVVSALLLQATCLLSLNDIPTAGTLLGEVGERIENGEVQDPNILRFFRAQIARYQG